VLKTRRRGLMGRRELRGGGGSGGRGDTDLGGGGRDGRSKKRVSLLH